MILKNTTKCMAMALCLAGFFVVGATWGGDAASEEAEAMKKSLDARIGAMISSPAGVFDIEIINGELVRLKIKAEAEAPTSMRGARADRFAREKAIREAKAFFTKFLGEKVIFVESSFEGVLIKEKDGNESSQVLDASAKLYASHSDALLKGLIVIMERFVGEGEGRSCMVILGWSKKLSDAADTVRGEMSSESTEKRKDAPASANAFSDNNEAILRVGNLDDF